MSPRRPLPYRSGYRQELAYPNKGGVLLPSHGDGPRCRVDYDPNDDGPLTTLQIMRIDDNDVVENYACAMPRCYAIPLILINKQLTFYEAQCRPDGTPLSPSRGGGIKQRDLREYSYLYHLRSRFLQAVFDMNHERLLNERWRCGEIHGFLHRMYRRFGHDTYQRHAYWREEIKERRAPYTAPDIAEMDWKAYIIEDMTTSTRINAFLWNRVSQGYTRVVMDEPPFESWRAWRAGHRDHKPVLYLAPASSPVRELPSELDGVSANAVAELATQGPSSDGGAGVRTVTAPPTLAVAAAAAAAATTSSSRRMVTSYPECAATGSRRGVGLVAGVTAGNGDGDAVDSEGELEYENVTVLTTALTGPPNSQEWALSFPSSSSQLSQSSLSSSSSSGGTTGRSISRSTSGQGRLVQRQFAFTLNAPEDMDLSVIRCTLTSREGVKKNVEPKLEVDYVKNLS